MVAGRRWLMRYEDLPEAVRRHYPWPGRFLALEDHTRLHYLDEGQGEPVLMVHGNPTWSFYYRDLVRALSGERRCVVPDHVGCGLSDKPVDWPYGLTSHIRSLQQLIEHLDLRDITLMVHDWGGAIGFGAVMKYPERVKRLVIFNTAVFDGPMPLPIRMARGPVAGALMIRGMNAFLRETMRMFLPKRAGKGVEAGYLAPYDSWDHRVAIHRFVQDIPIEQDHPTRAIIESLDRGLAQFRHLPALIVWGERDFVFTREFREGWRARLPDAEIHSLPRAGHLVVEDAHEEIVELLRDFLARPPRPSGQGDASGSPTFNAASRLRAHALERPEAPALRVPAARYTSASPAWDTYTFGELDRLSDAYARGLAAGGVRREDRALVLFKPSVDFYAVNFALFKVGAVPVLLDPGMGLRRLLRCIEDAGARVLIGMPSVHAVRLLRRGAFAAVEIPITTGARRLWGSKTLTECRVPGDEPFPLARLQGSDRASLLFTSGSTGPPKGVVTTQAMFQAQLDSLREMLNLRPGLCDVQAFAPFAVLDVCAGMCSVIPRIDLSKPAAAPAAEIVAAIRENRPEIAFGSPIIWHNVSRHCVEHGIRLSSLRTVLTVGAPVPAYLHRRFRQILAEGAEVLTPYGATEALPVTSIGSAEILDDTWKQTTRGAGTCVGRPAPGIDLRIIGITEEAIDRWRPDLALAPGEVGEIVVGGLQVSTAYHRAAEANRLSKIRDGDRVLHRMGDLGYVDGQGRLWFCGRKAHRLETADGVVPAVQVEGVFNEHPDVFRTALVGVGEPGRQIPVLCVEMEPGRRFTEDTVAGLRALAEGTRYAGLVRHFLPHDGLPTDARHNSKIRREELRGWAAARVRAGGHVG